MPRHLTSFFIKIILPSTREPRVWTLKTTHNFILKI